MDKTPRSLWGKMGKQMENEMHGLIYKRGEFPNPFHVLIAALAKIEPDGTVTDSDDKGGNMLSGVPQELIDVEILPKRVYDLHLIQVSRTIFGTVSHIARWPKNADRWLECLAIYISSYRHNKEFLQKATSLGHIDVNGFMHEPKLPTF